MRWLINYFRQCFCKHNFEFEEKIITITDMYDRKSNRTIISMLCKNCGYHKKVSKFCD